MRWPPRVADAGRRTWIAPDSPTSAQPSQAGSECSHADTQRPACSCPTCTVTSWPGVKPFWPPSTCTPPALPSVRRLSAIGSVSSRSGSPGGAVKQSAGSTARTSTSPTAKATTLDTVWVPPPEARAPVRSKARQYTPSAEKAQLPCACTLGAIVKVSAAVMPSRVAQRTRGSPNPPDSNRANSPGPLTSVSVHRTPAPAMTPGAMSSVDQPGHSSAGSCTAGSSQKLCPGSAMKAKSVRPAGTVRWAPGSTWRTTPSGSRNTAPKPEVSSLTLVTRAPFSMIEAMSTWPRLMIRAPDAVSEPFGTCQTGVPGSGTSSSGAVGC